MAGKRKREGVRLRALSRLPARRKSSTPPSSKFPEFCDFSCTYAGFSPPGVAGACRREEAVYCAYLGEYNRKHARCIARNRLNKT